jgi:hypothetical protein
MCAVAVLAAGSIARAADAPPPPALARMIAAEKAVTSFHVAMVAESLTADLDFVRPGNWHLTSPLAEIVHVGDDLYVKRGGGERFRHVPTAAMTMLQSRLGAAMSMTQGPEHFASRASDVVFVDAGAGTLDGKPMHKVRIVKAGNAPATVLWIGNDDLLYGVDAVTKSGRTTSLRYSRYNDVKPIAAPV